MRSLLRRVLFVTVLGSGVSSALAADGLVTEIMPIGYRAPQQLLAILEPLVPAPGSLSATNDHLIVTTTRDNLRQIKDLLATLDRPPRNLLVSIHYGKRATAQPTAGKASAKMRAREWEPSIGDAGANVHRGATSRMQGNTHDEGVAVQIWRTESASDSRQDQQLRVIDGAPACITRGKLAPVGVQKALFINGALVEVAAATHFVDFDKDRFGCPCRQIEIPGSSALLLANAANLHPAAEGHRDGGADGVGFDAATATEICVRTLWSHVEQHLIAAHPWHDTEAGAQVDVV
nr:hypothetical protein [Gammaproteobacteria bacterium]